MPITSGYENRHRLPSSQGHMDQTAQDSIIKLHPRSISSSTPRNYLNPLRDDVTLVDPCSGFVSPGADADLRPGTGKSIPCLVDQSDVKPQHTDPWQLRSHLQNVRCLTAPPGRAVICHAQFTPSPPMVFINGSYESDLRDLIHKAGTRWNSVARSDAALRATLGGWTSKIKTVPQVNRGPGTSLAKTFVLQRSHDASCSRDDIVRKFMYTSSTQRAYEEVPWDIKLPTKIQAPESTTEKVAAPISQLITLKEYELQPEIWQDPCGMWDGLQKRMFHAHKKPLTFISPYPRMEHIPGYCGFTGSVNSEDMDNPNATFTPFTKVRTAQPGYASTAHTPNIPGYTGRVHWMAIHPANSNLPSPFLSADTKMNGSPLGSRIGTAFQHHGPLSKMVTTVSPRNPFNKVEKKQTVEYSTI
ncbi:protein SPMIP7 isoform X1 [Mixophyes fleayi]|uniref:protein SPMIP7 isoform X1 n=1 Tax=Mixophyes fleayi TaxID=3061075 RepID=UPI003F4E16E9